MWHIARRIDHRPTGAPKWQGKSLKNILRKISAEGEFDNWVELLPRVLYCYHNTKGESGLTPFQMVFGRERNEVGLPIQPPRDCESATSFCDRMKALDERISEERNSELRRVAERVNSTRRGRPEFREGDLVWVLRPQGVSSGMDTWWTGPCKVVERNGSSSYKVWVNTKAIQEVHLDQLKPYVPDLLSGKPCVMFEFRGGYKPEGIPTGEGWIENILNHRIVPDGTYEFLVHWRGTPTSEDVWEPASSLVTEIGSSLEDYCAQHDIELPERVEPEEVGSIFGAIP